MKNLLSRLQLIRFSEQSDCRLFPNVVSILTIEPCINAPVQGNLLRQLNERLANLPQDIRVSKAREDACFCEKGFSWAIFCDNS